MYRSPSRSLQKHLKEEHNVSTFSEYLKEIIYGGIDGIVTTFAVVAGFTGAQAQGSMTTIPILAVVLFGLANLFADGTSMGLGNYLSLRSARKLYENAEKKEAYEIEHNADMEREETMEILQKEGFSEKDAEQLTTLYAKNPKYWTQFMMNYELQMPNPGDDNPAWNGLATFCSFLVFGFIPLIPYIFLKADVSATFQYSISFTAFALILLGLLRWHITKEIFWRSMFETILIGGIAAVVAFIVGSFFR